MVFRRPVASLVGEAIRKHMERPQVVCSECDDVLYADSLAGSPSWCPLCGKSAVFMTVGKPDKEAFRAAAKAC